MCKYLNGFWINQDFILYKKNLNDVYFSNSYTKISIGTYFVQIRVFFFKFNYSWYIYNHILLFCPRIKRPQATKLSRSCWIRWHLEIELIHRNNFIISTVNIRSLAWRRAQGVELTMRVIKRGKNTASCGRRSERRWGWTIKPLQ